MRSLATGVLAVVVVLLSAATCAQRGADNTGGGRATGTRTTALAGERVAAYSGGLVNKFEDYGWAPRELVPGAPARVDVKNYGGWILARKGFDVDVGAVSFRYRAPRALGDFLGVRLGGAEGGRELPEVEVRAHHRKSLEGDWEEVEIPLAELRPLAVAFDRVTIRARRGLPSTWIEIDEVAFVCAAACAARAPTTSTPSGPMRDPMLSASRTLPGDVVLSCREPSRAISPGIYGIAHDARLEKGDRRFLWSLKPSGRRWGGNANSRYNWKLGNAWNTAEDWYFRNVDYTGVPGAAWERFLRENRERAAGSAITLPLVGWVAKDTKSVGFPVSVYGPQQATDPNVPDAGNGRARDGSELLSVDPSRTSVRADDAFLEGWVKEMVALDTAEGARHVELYLLGNEPMLWSSTHRDVHPEPTTYDELLAKVLSAGRVVRRVDPKAKIAAPGLWGWPAYFFSALDKEKGFFMKPDRRAHGDVPLLEWLLQSLKAHEQKTGERILDYVDVHFYPPNVYNDKTDRETAALRLRSTRSFWDPTYVDETWIKEPVQLIPRMQDIIARTDPKLGLVIGEYNLGGERHISGGLALADVLGRFGALGVDYAYYWTYPPESSPAYWAFRAYRDYDDAGARFLDRSIPARAPPGLTVFGSTNDAQDAVVAVAVNFDAETAHDAHVTVDGCAAPTAARAFSFSDGQLALAPAKITLEGTTARVVVPPSSFLVVELTAAAPKR